MEDILKPHLPKVASWICLSMKGTLPTKTRVERDSEYYRTHRFTLGGRTALDDFCSICMSFRIFANKIWDLGSTNL